VTPRYWFRAKRYGWGWGFPRTWEGWVAFGVFGLVLLVAPAFTSDAQYVVVVLVTAAALVAVCWWKGEPPRWRWGRRL
jgi:hypothetical protein